MGKFISDKNINFSKWYNDIVIKADLAEHSDIRGCMIIKPYGYAIWEKIKAVLDNMFKKTGHLNAYFPLLIPKSFLSKESKHIDGFAKECAVVTHSKLKSINNEILIDDNSKLKEELIIRPTSETLIWHTYKKWIKSYKDLPLLINQWSNVIRWEIRTRLFLRTSEFLWQEGHTAHASSEEAIQEAILMRNIYNDFIKNWMAIETIMGIKTPKERFAGAIETYCIEGLMQDKKSLQMGTSHFLGQIFSKAFDVKFLDQNNNNNYVWSTSWGVSTRLMGALIMSHSDDKGLVLPPKLAPWQVVIIPVYDNDLIFNKISHLANNIMEKLNKVNITSIYDNKKYHRPGFKFSHYELKGVPIRITIGPNDLQDNTLEIFRRDTRKKMTIYKEELISTIENLLKEIQSNLYKRNKNHMINNTHFVDNYDDLKKTLNSKGGMIMSYWDGSQEIENKIKNETQASIICIADNKEKLSGKSIISKVKSNKRVLFAKSY
ncbi:MAG: proline--tRNA ligase [Bacteroides sp.]|nr:MAG: proline--tRNA ligase [Bacteroides sp.]